MKAVVFHGIGKIRLDDAPEPKIERATDVIVRLLPVQSVDSRVKQKGTIFSIF